MSDEKRTPTRVLRERFRALVPARVELGLQDSESGKVTLSKSVPLNAGVYRDDEERKALPLREIIVPEWPHDAEPTFTVHGYPVGTPPSLQFAWEWPGKIAAPDVDEETGSALQGHLLEIVEDRLRLSFSPHVIWANWVRVNETSTAKIERERAEHPASLVIDSWSFGVFWLELHGHVSLMPTVEECLDFYCELTESMHSVFNEGIALLDGYRARQ